MIHIYLCGSVFPAIRVHGWHDMDTREFQELVDHTILSQVAITQFHGQLEQHLPRHHLITVHVPNVLELWLHCKDKENQLTLNYFTKLLLK